MKSKFTGLVVMLDPNLEQEDAEAIIRTFNLMKGITTIQTIDAAANTDNGVAGMEILRILDAVKGIIGGK